MDWSWGWDTTVEGSRELVLGLGLVRRDGMGGVIWGWIGFGWIVLDCVVLGDGMEGCRGCDLEGEWEWELVLAWVRRDGTG